MFDQTDHPLLLMVISFVAMWVFARIGWSFLRRRLPLDDQLRSDFGFILPAALTLLGLIVGFSFSMATSRYDQRKNYKEAEANAIGTEFLRAQILPQADASKVQSLLKRYLEQRILFYEGQDRAEVQEIDSRTSELQEQMWAAILPATQSQPTPMTALVVEGMNDVLNSQGYTQSAFWYRIPVAAWELMLAIALVCNLLMGYGAIGSLRRQASPDPADPDCGCVHADRRHRLASPRADPHQSAEPHQPRRLTSREVVIARVACITR